MITNYVNGFGPRKATAAPTGNGGEGGEDVETAKASESQISEVEKRIEDKLKEIEAAHEELRKLENDKREEEKRQKTAQKRSKYEKKVRKKYDLMNKVYEKWKEDRPAKLEELQSELTKILWSDAVHANLAARLEFAKEAHSYAFGMCDEINSDIHDASKEINPEKRHAKLTVKNMILLENLQRSRDIATAENEDLTAMCKLFVQALYLCRIQVFFLEISKGAEQMHDMLSKIKDQLLEASTVTEELLASWDEFKKIFDEFDHDVDNDGPTLEEIGKIVSQTLALMAASQQIQPVEESASRSQPVTEVPATPAASVESVVQPTPETPLTPQQPENAPAAQTVKPVAPVMEVPPIHATPSVSAESVTQRTPKTPQLTPPQVQPATPKTPKQPLTAPKSQSKETKKASFQSQVKERRKEIFPAPAKTKTSNKK